MTIWKSMSDEEIARRGKTWYADFIRAKVVQFAQCGAVIVNELQCIAE